MIKSKDGAVEVKGSTTVLMTDLSMIIKSLRETFEEEDIPKETGDKLIRKAVDVGFWTEDKLDKELSNMRAEVLIFWKFIDSCCYISNELSLFL